MSSSSIQTTVEGILGIQPKKMDKRLPDEYRPTTSVKLTTVKTDVRSFRNTNCMCLLGVFIASMVVNLCLLGSLAVMYMQLPENSATPTEAFPPSDSICLSCESLNVPNPESATLAAEVKVINIGDHTTLCCLRHSEHLRTMLNLIAGEYVHNERTGNGSVVAMIPKSTHPSAHLYLDATYQSDARMHWESDAGYGTAHVTGGVVYNNGSLRVREEGVYFLYSHLTLSVSPGTHTDGRDVIHCVQRYNRKLKETGNQLLLMSKMSVHDGDKKTTFLAANLRLRRNDEVFVQFSDPSLVYKFSPANYFGLYLL